MNSTAPFLLRWRKATASQGSQGCVELAPLHERVIVRDSKDPDGPRLLLDRSAWSKLAERVKHGELDL